MEIYPGVDMEMRLVISFSAFFSVKSFIFNLYVISELSFILSILDIDYFASFSSQVIYLLQLKN